MGLFDYVHCKDPRFTCSEGHALDAAEFQTKDLGCTMGDSFLEADGVLAFDDGGWGDPPPMPLNATIEIYCDCRQCPALVQRGTDNLIPTGVDFAVTFVDGRATDVRRTSLATAEQLATTALKPYMAGCAGPMPYADAYALHVGGWTNDRLRGGKG